MNSHYIFPVHAVAQDQRFGGTVVEDMSIPGFRLHPLKGREKGRWVIWVNGSWTYFEFRDGDVSLLDYEDYH